MMQILRKCVISSVIGFSSMIRAQFALPTFQAVNSQDKTGPRITITATDGLNSVASGSLTNDATLTITFTANETVTGFAVGDVGVTGGSLSSFSGSGATYTATFTPSSDRNTTVYIPANVYTDQSSNNNLSSNPFYWSYDGTVPTYVSGTYITSDNSEVKIRFSENVYHTGAGSGLLETGDFTLSISGGSATLGSSNPTAVTKDTPTFSSRAIDLNLDGAWGLVIADLDSDDDQDIIAGGYQGNDLNWYENNGSAYFTERAIDLNLSGVLGLAVNDIDGDGDLDIFATAKTNDQVALYTNNGSQSFTKSLISSDLDGPHSVGCNDLDDDGYMDVIVSVAIDNEVVWYKNDGAQNFTENLIDDSMDAPLNFVVIDLDEDGDKDVIVAAKNDDDVIWLSNDGSENFTKNTIDNNLKAARDLVVIDLDEDGDLDILATSDNSSGNEVVWYSNDGSENFTTNSIESSLNSANILQVGDIDGDNDLDVVVTSYQDDDLLWYSNDGSENFTKNFIDNDINGITVARVGDVDGDGYNDVVANSKLDDDVMLYTFSDSGYVLNISLSGTAYGSETLTISPTSSSIYDIAGNVAATSQSYSTVTLNNLNYVLDFDGTNDHAYVANSSDFEPDNFTVQAWINLDAFESEDYFVYRHKTWFIGFSRSGTKIEGGVRDDDGDWLYPISTTTPSAGGGWYHVVLVFNGTGSSTEYAYLYINGSLEDTESSSNHDLNSQSNYVSVGAKNNSGTISNYFNGQVDEVAFWNEVLTASEVTALYNSGTPLDAGSNSGNYTSSPGLVAFYKFQQNANTETGSHNLTTSGSPTYSHTSIP
jgi:hypothetical protein